MEREEGVRQAGIATNNAVREKPCRYCQGMFTTRLNRIVYCSIDCAFWIKVNVMGGDECWPWTAAHDKRGYGHLRKDGRIYKAHRLAFALSKGMMAEELDGFVLHGCDNPACCNPAHLRLGDQLDNMRDASVRNRIDRSPRVWGEGHHNSKLNGDAVRVIRSSDLPMRVLAERFGVTPTAVCLAKNGKTWRHIK